MENQVVLIAVFRSTALLGLGFLIFILNRFSMRFRSGDVMPQCEFRLECEPKGAQHNTCRPNDLPNGHIPDACWVKRARRRHRASKSTNAGSLDCRDGSTSAVSKKNPWKHKDAFSPVTNGTPAGRRRVADEPRYTTANGHQHGASESTNADSLDRSDSSTSAVSPKNPQKQKDAFSPVTNGTPARRWRVADVPRYTTANGHQHGASESTNAGSLDRRDWSTKVVSPKNSGKQKGAFSPVTNGTPAGRWRVADVPQYATANGAARFGVTQYYKPERASPGPSLPASKKKRWGKKRSGNKKKRGADMTFPEGYKPLLMSLQEKEDWDEEIQDVTLKKRVELNVVTVPYGPEDVLHFSLQDLSLRQSNMADPPVAANYSPAVHHAHPMRWRRYRFATESEQFADAEEEGEEAGGSHIS
ncbi:uncharacterized protein LOC103137747 isoform X1 [Poecilia formosa]|uniref:uncharacterized protein LOC103137747 isoform X1 n=2 Tax=Poecilia formosa TaxID=48698 RepID=UPI00044428CB|nr:PREDICTED: uncharacterized protein LOC103137747 isoform X1 [Poecilia formosa]